MESQLEIRRFFPTPLARQFQQLREVPDDHQASFLTRIFGETLRFAALLSIQDAMAHRLLLDTSPPENVFKRATPLGTWTELLKWSCKPATNARFFSELRGVYQQDLFDRLLRGRNDLAHYPPPNTYVTDVGDIRSYAERLQELFQQLSFLKRYLFIKLTRLEGLGAVRCIPLRGSSREADPLDLTLRDCVVESNELFVLDPDTRRAMRISPAFRTHSFTSAIEEVCGLTQIESSQSRFTFAHYESFSSTSELVLCAPELEDSRKQPVLRTWTKDRGAALTYKNLNGAVHALLGNSLSEKKFGVNLSDRLEIDWVLPLLTEESWDRVREFMAPPPNVTTVGGRFHVESVLRSGELTELYVTKDERHPEDRVLVQVPATSTSVPELVARYFRARFQAWTEMSGDDGREPCADVLESMPASTLDPSRGGPFIAIRLRRNVATLEKRVRTLRELPGPEVFRIMSVAARICQAAADREIRMLALPLRHFLEFSATELGFTGFDTALPRGECLPSPEAAGLLFKDCASFAPELYAGNCRPAETADVFALGVLLRSIRQVPGRRHAGSSADSFWDGLAFHCLADDPGLRFQSIRHFSSFLRKCDDSAFDSPELVYVHPTDTAPAGNGTNEAPVMEFSIGKYPVTNLEYVRFVESAGSKTLPAGLSEASTGPFLPVVGISQRDALEYCRWLSDSLKRKYRIPTEREWICAATRANADSFGNRRGFANYGYRFGGPTVVGAFRRPDADDGCSDLFGNVWEWCLDRYPEQPWRVLKGGSFRSVAHELTPWFRRGELIAHRSPFVGFRVVREE